MQKARGPIRGGHEEALVSGEAEFCHRAFKAVCLGECLKGRLIDITGAGVEGGVAYTRGLLEAVDGNGRGVVVEQSQVEAGAVFGQGGGGHGFVFFVSAELNGGCGGARLRGDAGLQGTALGGECTVVVNNKAGDDEVTFVGICRDCPHGQKHKALGAGIWAFQDEGGHREGHRPKRGGGRKNFREILLISYGVAGQKIAEGAGDGEGIAVGVHGNLVEGVCLEEASCPGSKHIVVQAEGKEAACFAQPISPAEAVVEGADLSMGLTQESAVAQEEWLSHVVSLGVKVQQRRESRFFVQGATQEGGGDAVGAT